MTKIKLNPKKKREWGPHVSLDVILHTAMHDCLDELALNLQKWAYKEAEEWKKDTKKNEIHYKTARAYLDAVGEINRKFGTNYAESIEKVRNHFEDPGPAKYDR